MRGASAIEHILDESHDPRLRVFVIWEPIRATDWSAPGSMVLGRVSDPRAAQFWDKDHLFATRLESRIESDPLEPRPSCCKNAGFEWDEVAIYSPAARWDDRLPRAEYLDGPVYVLRDLSRVISDQLSHAGESKTSTAQPPLPECGMPYDFHPRRRAKSNAARPMKKGCECT
ncbi:MAG: hypothetical protein ACRD50_15090 [Candidatus Acidiferrales bacterium]